MKQFRRILVITPNIRTLKRVHKLGQYSTVHKFACVYLKIKPNQLSGCALYHKMMQYGIKLSTKHPSETNKIFKIVIINHFLIFTIFQLCFRYFVIETILA